MLNMFVIRKKPRKLVEKTMRNTLRSIIREKLKKGPFLAPRGPPRPAPPRAGARGGGSPVRPTSKKPPLKLPNDFGGGGCWEINQALIRGAPPGPGPGGGPPGGQKRPKIDKTEHMRSILVKLATKYLHFHTILL